MDVVKFARKNRYRLRDLHDGGPVPAGVRPPKRIRHHADEHIGIEGRFGWLADEPPGIGFYISMKNGIGRIERRLKRAGAIIKQSLPTELSGYAPMSLAQTLCDIVKPWRRQSARDTKAIEPYRYDRLHAAEGHASELESI